MRSYLLALSLFASFFFSGTAFAGGDMSDDLHSGQFWKIPKDELFGKYFNGEWGVWLDTEQTKMRIAKPNIKLNGMDLGEMLVQWEEGAPQNMTVMVYNKGDNGLISEEEFRSRLQKTKDVLNKVSGVEGKEHKTSRKEALVKLNGWIWVWDGGAATVEANTSRDNNNFEAEFIRLKIGPNEAAISRADASSRATKSDIKKHVIKEGKRIVIKDIPMVDQGQKGYCVVATASRIFAYFGMDYVDQHELASLCNTSASGGTSTEVMAESLKKIGSRFQIRVKVLDTLVARKDFANLIKDYNRAAGRLKKQKLDQNSDWNGIWETADADVLRQARAGSQGQIDRWTKTIRPYLEAGIPILWSVQLGIVPEPKYISQSRGGHLRLIIGLDDEKKTVIFSDTWGAEHMEKEMPIVDAMSITTSRQIMQPSK